MSDKPQKPILKKPRQKKGNSTDNKSTKAEVNQRVSEIKNLLTQGYTRSHIIQYGSKWSVSDRQIDDYISMATIQIKEHNAYTYQENVTIVTDALWDVYRASRAANDRKAALTALSQIAKIKGLEQHTVNHVITDDRDWETSHNASVTIVTFSW